MSVSCRWLASDLVLGLDWLNLVRPSAPDLVVHLSSGLFNVRYPSVLPIGTSESGSPLSAAVVSLFRGGISVDPCLSSPSVSSGGPGVTRSQPGHPVRGTTKVLVREVPHRALF
ncbi:hypothetical protein B0H13DRAFT_2649363 [Mycena leptocephala]|nr:hypothetical protein B0H13DRAFT_2649363 [Mycena leptocephala]